MNKISQENIDKFHFNACLLQMVLFYPRKLSIVIMQSPRLCSVKGHFTQGVREFSHTVKASIIELQSCYLHCFSDTD